MVFDSTALFNAFSPFRYLDLSSIYDQYASVIDFFLYLAIFVGLTQWVFESRFSGRGGRAITIGVGTALAGGLALAESRLDFSLRTLGPFAGLILILLVALVIYHLFRGLGLGAFSSGVVALLTMYFGVGSLAPGLLGWVGNLFPLIHVVAAASLFYLLVRMVIRVVEHAEKGPLGSMFSSAGPPAARELTEEHRALSLLEPEIRRDRVETEATVRDLKDLYRFVQTDGVGPKAAAHVQDALHRVRDREYLILQRIDYLKMVDRNLKAFDLGMFHRLKAEYDALPAPERASMRRALEQERAKVFSELDLEQLTDRARSELSDCEAALRIAEIAFRENDGERAKRALLRAIKSDKRIERVLHRLQRAEHRLLRMTPKS